MEVTGFTATASTSPSLIYFFYFFITLTITIVNQIKLFALSIITAYPQEISSIAYWHTCSRSITQNLKQSHFQNVLTIFFMYHSMTEDKCPK